MMKKKKKENAHPLLAGAKRDPPRHPRRSKAGIDRQRQSVLLAQLVRGIRILLIVALSFSLIYIYDIYMYKDIEHLTFT